jgi:hypothetical protein
MAVLLGKSIMKKMLLLLCSCALFMALFGCSILAPVAQHETQKVHVKTLWLYRIRHFNEPVAADEKSELSNRDAANEPGLVFYLTKDYCHRFDAQNKNKDRIVQYQVEYRSHSLQKDFGTYIRCHSNLNEKGDSKYVCDPRNTYECKYKICHQEYIDEACLKRCPPIGSLDQIGAALVEPNMSAYFYSLPLNTECAANQPFEVCSWRLVKKKSRSMPFSHLLDHDFICKRFTDHSAMLKAYHHNLGVFSMLLTEQ